MFFLGTADVSNCDLRPQGNLRFNGCVGGGREVVTVAEAVPEFYCLSRRFLLLPLRCIRLHHRADPSSKNQISTVPPTTG